MKRLVALALGVTAFALLGSNGAVHAQELASRLPNVSLAARTLRSAYTKVNDRCGWTGMIVRYKLSWAVAIAMGLPPRFVAAGLPRLRVNIGDRMRDAGCRFEQQLL